MIQRVLFLIALLVAAPAVAQDWTPHQWELVGRRGSLSAAEHITVMMICDRLISNPNDSQTCVQPDRRPVTWLPGEPSPRMSRVFEQPAPLLPTFIESGPDYVADAPPAHLTVDRWLANLPPLAAADNQPAEQPRCHVPLAWHDKWLVLPLLAASGFRDAVSTIRTLAYVEAADEGNGVFAVVGADPRKNPRRFAYVKGGITGGVAVATGLLMTSCDKQTRVAARLAALGGSGIFVWAARNNDDIFEMCTRPGVVCRRK